VIKFRYLIETSEAYTNSVDSAYYGLEKAGF